MNIQEKIDRVVKYVEENGIPEQYRSLWVFDQLRYIVQEAIQAEKERILSELPEERYGLDYSTEYKTGFNNCLSQVKQIISKP